MDIVQKEDFVFWITLYRCSNDTSMWLHYNYATG